MKSTRGQTKTAGDRGFSLIELLIALVVTLIVCGGVTSLLVEGNRSFQIQPDMTERQQNIRAAMDLIMKDVANAGAGLPLGAQVFSLGFKGTGQAAPSGGNSDELEMLTNEGGIDPLSSTPAALGGSVTVQASRTQYLAGMPVAVTMADGTFVLRRITAVTAPAAGTGTTLILTSGGGGVCDVAGTNTTGGNYTGILYQDVVHYRIWSETEDSAQAPIPILQRQSVAGGCQWQTVARGIEDMRVSYRRGADVLASVGTAEPCATPGGVCPLPLDQPANMTAAPGLDSVTVEVQVQLQARGGLITSNAAVARPMMTTENDGTHAFRGKMISRGTPRAALSLLNDGRWQ